MMADWNKRFMPPSLFEEVAKEPMARELISENVERSPERRFPGGKGASSPPDTSIVVRRCYRVRRIGHFRGRLHINMNSRPDGLNFLADKAAQTIECAV